MENIVREIHEGIKLRPCEDHNYPPHFHNDLEMIFVLEGEFQAICSGVEFTVTAGSVFLAAPKIIHAYKSPIHSCKTLLLIIDATLLSGEASKLVHNSPIYPIWHGTEQKSIIWEMIQYAYKNRDIMHPENFVLMLSTAVSLIIGDMALEGTKHKLSTEQRILLYCMDHYREAISLGQVANALGISESHISHLFSNSLGISFPTYINGLRLNDAVKMLETSHANIIDIANQSGFSSLRSFNHIFAKQYKMTPTQYRQAHSSK